MADNSDLTKGIAKMLVAALDCRADTVTYGRRVAEGLGVGEDDTEETMAAALRKALGLPPAPQCRCGITPGAPKDVVPYACQVHGTPCAGCGQFDGCPEDCDGEARDPAAGVPVIGTMKDSAGDEVRFGAFIGGVVIGCGSSPVILGENAKEEEFAQLYVAACTRAAAARAEVAEDEAGRLAHAAWREGEDG